MRAWRAWIPAGAYMALIFTISSLSLRRAHLPRNSDKLIHFVEYGVLALLVTYAWRRTRRQWSARRAAVWAWLFAAAYGATDEVHQLFVPYRSCSLYDWLADATGAALAAALLALVWKKHHKESPSVPDDPAVPRQAP